MWLKKLVGLSMLITLIGMNAIVLIGFFQKTKNATSFSLSQEAPAPVKPTVTLEAKPTEVQTGLFSALTWSVTGEITGCTATGDWAGPKTQFGSESTGRLGTEGTKNYTLTCKNASGSDSKTVSVRVTQSAVAVNPTPSTNNTPSSPSTPAAPVYCGGAAPCYGPREVASHGSAGNCWGYNGDRVINITGLDSGFHKAQTGVSSIEVSGVCGKDLADSLGGSVSAGGQTQNHKATTKANADRNLIPYLVGYYDSKKP